MKRIKREIALFLTLCMVFTGAVPAYAEEMTVPEKNAEAAEMFTEAEVSECVAEEAVEANYDSVAPFDGENEAAEKPEKDSEENVPEENLLKKATPSDAKKNTEEFIRETIVDGVKITLTADPGVFPEDAELWAEKVEDTDTEEAIEEAVEKERDNNVNVALSYKFDIKMFVNGEEVQPDTSKGSVKVTFTLAEALSECLEANAYHLKEEASGELTAENLGAEVKTVDEAAEEIEAETDSFSYYVVEFTYNELQYVLPGDSNIKLSEILKTLGIEGTVTAAEVSNPELFTVKKDTSGEDWTVEALKAFNTTERLTVILENTQYDITVTDASQGETIYYKIDKDNYILYISSVNKGEGYMNFDTYNTPPWQGLPIKSGINSVIIESVIRPSSVCSWFSGFTSLTSITGSYMDTSNVANMSGMFSGCTSLTTLDLGKLQTSNVANMSGMFSGCTSLISLDLGNFNTSNVTNMSGMFKGCSSLETIYVQNFSTQKVNYSDDMFTGCIKLLGGNGTGFVSSKTDKGYACIDKYGQNGYLTYGGSDRAKVSFVSKGQIVYTRTVQSGDGITVPDYVRAGCDGWYISKEIKYSPGDEFATTEGEAAYTLYDEWAIGPFEIVEYYDYIDGEMVKRSIPNDTVTEYTTIDSNIVEPEGGYVLESGKWYVVKGNITFNHRIQNNASKDTPAHLILVDEKNLTASQGINTPNGKGLVIYGQSAGTGKFYIPGAPDYSAGIGSGKDDSGGDIIINGGTINAAGGYLGAGIGSGLKSISVAYTTAGNITINGGTVIATGGYVGAGIGGGLQSNGGSITINGGTVTATGGSDGGGGIGGGKNSTGGSITINGGTVTATGGSDGAGIGGGKDSSGGNITINEGTVTATGGSDGAGIGGGKNSSGGNITINGGTVTATGGKAGTAAIGGGFNAAEHGTITLDDSMEIFAGTSKEDYDYKPLELYLFSRDTYAKVNTLPEYTVAHYKQKADGTGYEDPETETLHGHTGEKTEADFRSYDGFTLKSLEQQIVKADSSTVVDIQYDRLKYTLVFDSNGHGRAPAAITALYGAKVTKPADPTATGYTFCGWYEEEACTTPYTFTTMPLGGKTIYAKWEKSPEKKYTITWMLNDIMLIDTTEVTEGEMPTHSNPAIEGRIFIGWKPALAPVTGNVKYTAYFEERGTNKIAVTFHTDGGTFIDTQVIDRNTTPVRPSDPQKAGCRFEGWYREAGFVTPYEFGEPFNTDMTLYAKWEVLPVVVHTVTWNMDDDTLIDTTRVNEGEMPVHENPSKEGYIFVGWNPAPAPVMSDITYTARFEKRSPDKAAVTFNTDGGSFVETQVITKGQKAVRPSDPAKTGYEFVNWYADAAFAALYDFNTAVTADITVYAKWKKTAGREYTITFKDWDGKTLAATKVEEGGLPDYPGTSDPSRSGYIFTGWTPKIGLAYADKTYTATYAPQTVINGGGGGGGSAPAVKKPVVTFSPNWYSDIYGVWRIKNSKGEIVKNAWLCDDAVAANGQNVWYLLGADGAMLAAGLVQDATGSFYSLETNHDGYFGMLRYTDGYYNCNGQQVYLQFSQKHDGTFGAVINADGIEKLKAIYGVTQYGIGNENAVYTKTF